MSDKSKDFRGSSGKVSLRLCELCAPKLPVVPQNLRFEQVGEEAILVCYFEWCVATNRDMKYREVAVAAVQTEVMVPVENKILLAIVLDSVHRHAPMRLCVADLGELSRGGWSYKRIN